MCSLFLVTFGQEAQVCSLDDWEVRNALVGMLQVHHVQRQAKHNGHWVEAVQPPMVAHVSSL